MAEIRVEQQRKRGLGWLWLLIILALVALAIWYFNTYRVDNVPAQGAALPAAAPVVAALAAPSADAPLAVA